MKNFTILLVFFLCSSFNVTDLRKQQPPSQRNIDLSYLFLSNSSCRKQQAIVDLCIDEAGRLVLDGFQETEFLPIEEAYLQQEYFGHIHETQWNLFRLEVFRIAKRAKIRFPHIGLSCIDIYHFAMCTFAFESGFKANAKNPYGTASGIFQIIKSNRDKLGFPKNWIHLTALEQLKWYEVYLNSALGMFNDYQLSRINNYCDFYMINFAPAFAHRVDCAVLFQRGEGGYSGNKIFDVDGDGLLTKGEVKSVIKSRFDRSRVKNIEHMLLFSGKKLLKMKSMKKPCENCPFRFDSQKGWLGEARMREICKDTINGDKYFVCHKTSDRQLEHQRLCAGKLVLEERENPGGNSSTRVAIALGLFEGYESIENKHLVFDKVKQAIEHHS